MKKELDPHLHSLPDSSNTATTGSSNTGKAKMCWEDDVQQQDSGMDELLAVLGYRVRSSDMANGRDKGGRAGAPAPPKCLGKKNIM